MATLKITNIKCEKPSSGVDSGLVGTLSEIAAGAVGVVGAAATGAAAAEAVISQNLKSDRLSTRFDSDIEWAIALYRE